MERKGSAGQDPPLVVVLDGEIGAGKTTLISHLCRALRGRGVEAVVVPEPVEEWEEAGILAAFYDDSRPPEDRGLLAYAFQTFTFATRVRRTREVAAAHPRAQVFLLERSVLTDRCVFMELQREQVGPMLMGMYEKWWASWESLMPFAPQRFVYLKPALALCQERVRARARGGEVVSADYQARLREAHEAFLEGKNAGALPAGPSRLPGEVVVVDGPLADDDFSAYGSPAADAAVSFILGKLGLPSGRGAAFQE